MSRLDGKVCLVTGSSRGIGAAIAREFVGEGARVGITYLENEERAAQLASELGEDRAHCLRLDVSDRESVRNTFATLVARWQTLDVLVNNAGYLKQEPFRDITEEQWDRTFDTNMKGVFLCTQEAARFFEQQGHGCVINISSVGGQIGGPKAPHYAASKAAVLAFTKSSARLMAPHRVRVNAIAPGFIRTDMYEHILALNSEEAILAGIPLGRVGETRDVGRAAVFLASDDSSFITGECINVNGGQFMAA